MSQEAQAPTGANNQQHELYAALAKAQGEFTDLAKNRTVNIRMNGGGSYQFRYADLEACIKATRPALTKHGLAVIQLPEGDTLRTILTHEAGGVIETTVKLPGYNGNDPKSFGAMVTYFRRYTYSAVVGIAADDDLDENGQEASNDNQPRKSEPQQEAQRQPRAQQTSPGAVNQAMVTAITKALEANGKSQQAFCQHFKVKAITDLSRDHINAALEWAKS